MNPIRRLWQKAMKNEALREKLRIIIFQSDTPMGKAFDVALLWCIVASILVVVVESMQNLPATLKQVFTVLEYVFTFFFTMEYLCRLYCSDKPRQYALSFFGIIDLLSTLPLYIGWIFGPMRYLMVVRTFRLIRVFRVFKLFSFLQEGDLLMRSLIYSAPKIGVFFLFMVIMVISMGTLMFIVEGNIPDSPFTDIPTSIYWAVVTMTTVGYGDIAPATFVGRVLSAVVMLMGYTIMAVPTGIVSAQMVHDHKQRRKTKYCRECGSPLPNDAHYCPFCGLKQDTQKPAGKTILSLLLFMFLQSFTLNGLAQDKLLTGTVIGTRESVDYNNTSQPSTTVNTIADAFDGNLNTFFASWERSKTWVGIDLGTPHVITRVGWSPRNGNVGPKRMLLALFEGANAPDFHDAVPLYIIDTEGIIGTMSYADVNVSRGFRYVRYVGPADARCNVAEVEFYGHAGEGDDSRFYQLTNLPTVSFHTQDNVEPYDKVNEIPSSFTIIYADGTMIQEETGTTRLRGNASKSFPKKPYRIKLDSKKHMFKNSDMKSPAKAKKWTLINNYGDKSLMRNLVGFEIARRMKMSYVPWSKPVDVIVNGEYQGCYQLTDQISVDKDRVNITEMEPWDIEGEALTGGYLLELDGYASQETSWFTSAAGNPITIKSPDDDEITTEQAQYIRHEFNLMETKILASNFDDPVLGFRSRLDEKSLQRYWLVEELTGNPDAFHSCYISKERGEDLFRIGPIWDLDLAFDNDSRYYPNRDYGDYLSMARGGAGNSRTMLKRIFTDEAFCDSLHAMWVTARQEWDITEESLIHYIDSTAQELQESQRLNFIRWPILNTVQHLNPRVAGNYDGEVEYLREYIRERIPFLDQRTNNEDGGEEEHYDIATAEDLKDFADQVNSGKTAISATLTADIDFTAYPNVMIGTGSYYKGEFDGAGHSIKLGLNRTSQYAGLFCYLSGYVHDLITTGTITTSEKFAGGIAAQTEGATIERCQSKVKIVSTVSGDGTHGGIMGISNAGSFVRDCLVSGDITGSQTNCCGGVSGWASGSTSISGCLITSKFTISTSGSDLLARNSTNVTSSQNFVLEGWGAANACGDVELLTENQVSYGEACFLLERKQPGSTCWRQTLGTDAMPVPDTSHKIVYSFSRLHCDGTPYTSYGSFTNDALHNGQDEHDFANGACRVCGFVNIESMPRDERGYYLIDSPETLNWFAQTINQGNTDICGVLNNDIDFTAYPSTMIGNAKTYNGTFDGNGHTITIALVRNADYAGLFGHLSGTIQDLTVRGTITTNRKFAGMVANLLGGTVLRCQSYIDINATISGDGTHGGVAGLFSEASGIGQLQDCIFAGSINGDNVDCCGGLVGWATVMGFISNCFMAGNMNISSSGGDIICRNNSKAIIQDTYYLPPSTGGWGIPSDAISTNSYDMASGALCYQLNAGRMDDKRVWYQTLTEDSFPVPDNSRLPIWLYEGAYVNESPDGINEIKNEELRIKNNGAMYDLSGRQISAEINSSPYTLQSSIKKGIYIKNGKKYVK